MEWIKLIQCGHSYLGVIFDVFTTLCSLYAFCHSPAFLFHFGDIVLLFIVGFERFDL